MNLTIGKNSRFAFWCLTGYGIALHVIVATLIFETDFIQQLKAIKSGDSKEYLLAAGIAVLPLEARMCYQEAADMNTPESPVVFLGDSITQLLDTEKVAPLSVNHGIGGLNTDQLLKTIPSYKSLERSTAIFLLVGVNDFIQGHGNRLPEQYEKILAAIPATKPLIWSSLMPTDKADFTEIEKVNLVIQDLCSKRGHCTYIDTEKFLLDEGGAMRKDLFRDGLHLTEDGYRPWISELKRSLDFTVTASNH